MNYPENATKWLPGDLVLHDADAKETKMLMIVVGVSADQEMVTTIYLKDVPEPTMGKKDISNLPKVELWTNTYRCLHDPSQFKNVHRPAIRKPTEYECLVAGGHCWRDADTNVMGCTLKRTCIHCGKTQDGHLRSDILWIDRLKT